MPKQTYATHHHAHSQGNAEIAAEAVRAEAEQTDRDRAARESAKSHEVSEQAAELCETVDQVLADVEQESKAHVILSELGSVALTDTEQYIVDLEAMGEAVQRLRTSFGRISTLHVNEAA